LQFFIFAENCRVFSKYLEYPDARLLSIRDVFGTLDVRTLPAFDEFYVDKVKVPIFKELSSLPKIILNLSRGKPDVERGFSLNSGVLQDNIALKLIADRTAVS